MPKGAAKAGTPAPAKPLRTSVRIDKSGGVPIAPTGSAVSEQEVQQARCVAPASLYPRSVMSSPRDRPSSTEPPNEPKVQEGWHQAHLSATHEIAPFLDIVAGLMTGLGFPDKDVFGVRLALEEALVNSVKHGHRYDPTKRVLVRYKVVHEYALVEVEDQGPGFDPLQVPDPTALENLERPCGRGLLLMRAYASWIRHNERGNCVTLCKYPSAPPAKRASG
jgi:serine/threonine-protein kinase RsbW